MKRLGLWSSPGADSLTDTLRLRGAAAGSQYNHHLTPPPQRNSPTVVCAMGQLNQRARTAAQIQAVAIPPTPSQGHSRTVMRAGVSLC